MKIGYYDVETEAIDRLEGQRTIRIIHSLAIAINDEEPKVYTSRPIKISDGSIEDGITILNSCDILVGHNSSIFDKGVIEQAYNVKLLPKQIDTMILAKLTFTTAALYSIDYSLGWGEDKEMSKLLGSYSLEAFGMRLGNPKISFHDWSKLSEEMCIYNKQDVVVTRDLYLLLQQQETYPSQAVIDLEMDTANVIQLIQDHGFYVDRKAAETLRDELAYEKFTINKELLEKYKPMFLPQVVSEPHTITPSGARRSRRWVHNPYFDGFWVWKGETTLVNKEFKKEEQDEESE